MSIEPYVSLEQFKAELGITGAARDTMLTRKLNAASRRIDSYCKRFRGAFNVPTEASTRVFSTAGRVLDNVVYLDDIGSLDDLAIESGTAAGFTVVTGYDTAVSNGLAEGLAIESLYNPAGWPTWAGQQLRVTARWGWPELPDDVAEATMLQATRLLKRKDSSEGVVGSADWGQIRVSRVDPDVRELLEQYVRMVVG